jgi:ribosomal protein L11 methyltransferase
MPDPLPPWEFASPGPLRERLNGLALGGAKSTTFDLAVLETMFNETPEVGQRFTMLGSNAVALAVIEITAVKQMRLADVPWNLIEAEGESFRSFEHWRCAHVRYWDRFVAEVAEYLDDPAWLIDDDTIVSCTSFRIVERLSESDVARFTVVECLVHRDDLEWVSAELIDLDATGIEEVGSGPGATSTNSLEAPAGHVILRGIFASDHAGIVAEKSLDARWQPRFEVLLGDEWLDAWREHFEPQRIGGILVVGDWDGANSPGIAPTDAVIVRLDPARSFGTGTHASTRLMLQALQGLQLEGLDVLDVGCGSGILAISSLLLGAHSAHGTDIESSALQVTMSNAQRNRIAERCTVASSAEPLPQTFDVILANILAPVLIELAPALCRSVRPGGQVLLAGLIDEQVERVVTAYASLSLRSTLSEGNWRCLVFSAGA